MDHFSAKVFFSFHYYFHIGTDKPESVLTTEQLALGIKALLFLKGGMTDVMREGQVLFFHFPPPRFILLINRSHCEFLISVKNNKCCGFYINVNYAA